MSNLAITSAPLLTGVNTASGDLFPLVDVSASAGSKGSAITRDELGDAMTRTAAMSAALAAKLNLAGGTMPGVLVINPTTGAPLTVRRNSKTCFEVTNGEQINIGRYDGVFGSGTENVIGWSGKYGAGSWFQGGSGNWYTGFLIGAGTGEFRIASDAGGTNAVRLFNASASSLQLGANHATTPTDQTLKAHNVTTGVGAALKLCGGTGSVGYGAVIIGDATDMPAGFHGYSCPQVGTGGSAVSFVESIGTTVNDASTFGGYTLGQVVSALQQKGILA